jgi:hypothetical protein
MRDGEPNGVLVESSIGTRCFFLNQVAFIINSTKLNKYSYNALLGALESQGKLDVIDVFFYDSKAPDDLLSDCVKTYKKIVFAFSFFTTQIWDIYPELKRIRKNSVTELSL